MFALDWSYAFDRMTTFTDPYDIEHGAKLDYAFVIGSKKDYVSLLQCPTNSKCTSFASYRQYILQLIATGKVSNGRASVKAKLNYLLYA